MKRFLFVLMTAVMLIGGTISAYAAEYPENLPALPSHANGEYLVVNIRETYELYVTATNDANKTRFSFKDGMVYVTDNTQDYLFNLYQYNVGDSLDWDFYDGGSMKKAGELYYKMVNPDATIVYSTLDVYDYETGEVVFQGPPRPLAEEIRKLTAETLEAETMPELSKTVLVVVLCGVGCLALVTSLVLLRKILPRFLG